MERYHTLSSQEEHIISNKGTEAPWSGEYTTVFDSGVYACRRCDAPLFLSSDKFESDCGWPSFDDEISGTIDKKTDPDGRRIEILCHRCHAHLGHVFMGEQMTKKNVRHCVNSLSLRFIPTLSSDGWPRAIVAGGCFWKIQYLLQRQSGVVRATSGYLGGTVVHPTYDEVCTNVTGHAEAVEVVFDPEKTSYGKLLEYFFTIHDPSQYHRQGLDVGKQYRSAIFYLTKQQRDTALRLLQKLQQRGTMVTTEVVPAGPFYKAEECHQNVILIVNESE